jgi:hypothetical protein
MAEGAQAVAGSRARLHDGSRFRQFMPRSHTVVPVIAVLLGLFLVGAEIDSALRVINVPAGLTAKPARIEVGLYALAALAIAAAAIFLPSRLRALAVVGPGLALSGVLVASAILAPQIRSMVLALLAMCALWFTGRALLQALGARRLANHVAVAWLAGIAPLSLLTLLLGRLSIFRWWDMGLLVLGLGVMGAVRAGRLAWQRRRRVAEEVLATPLTAAGAGVVLLALAVVAIYAAAPEVEFDPLYAKAYLPLLWAHTGTIGPLTRHIQLNITGWFQVVAAWGDLFGGVATGRYLQLFALGGAAAIVWSWARRFNGLGPVAAAAVVITPAVFWQGTTADDDLLLAVAAFALTVAALEAYRLHSDREPPPVGAGGVGVVSLALGLLAGTGISLKSHLIPLSLLVLGGWIVGGRRSRTVLRRLAYGAIGAVVTAGPPLILRWIDTGNPVFPAYNNIFKSPYWLPINEKLNFPFWPTAGILGPVKAIWQGVFHPGLMNEAAPPGSFAIPVVVVLAAILIGWCFRRRHPGALLVWGAVVLAAGAWWIEFRYLRYLLPIAFAAGALLLAVLPQPRLSCAGLKLTAAGVALAAGASFAVVEAMFWNVPNQRVPVSAAFGRWSPSAYLTTEFPERAAILAFNRISPPHSIYVTGQGLQAFERAWLTGGRDLYASWELNDLLQIKRPVPRTGNQSWARLRSRGVDWVLVNPSDPTLADYPWLLKTVQGHGQLRFSANGWNLYQLVMRKP